MRRFVNSPDAVVSDTEVGVRGVRGSWLQQLDRAGLLRDYLGVTCTGGRVNSNKNVTEEADFSTVHSNRNVTGRPASLLSSRLSGLLVAFGLGHSKPVGKWRTTYPQALSLPWTA